MILLPIPIIGGVIVGVKWICMTAIPWLAAKVVIFWGYLTAKNLFLLGLVTWLAAELIGWGDGFRDFLIWLLGYVGGLLFDFFFGEDGFIWYIFDFGFWFCNWVIDVLVYEWGFIDYVSKPFEQFSPNLLQTVMPLIWSLDIFFPVNESLAFLLIYLGFLFVVLIVRWCLKLIPGGG